METAGFSQISSVTATSPNESRGSVTDVESTMESSGHGLSQQPSFSSATASTPAQSQDPAMVDMYRQTQVMLCDFLKEKNKKKSERQPFYDFVAAAAPLSITLTVLSLLGTQPVCLPSYQG